MASASDPLSPYPPCSRKRAAAVSLVGAPETPDKTPGRARPEEDHWTHIQPKLKAPQPPSSDVITFPRTAVGLNTLYQAIARDFPEAVRMRRGHWECNTQHTATRLTSIVGKDQYESPWSVVSVLKEKEGIDFDACATPFSAACEDFSVDVMHPESIPVKRTVFVNPPYGTRRWGIGCDGIAPVLQKLLDIDWRQRGSKIVALLPNWSHSPWFKLVLQADRIHYITSTIAFGNPFLDLDRAQPFMWPCIVAVFCPESSDKHQPRPPVWLPLDVQRGAAQPGRAQRCHLCRKWRVLPRSSSLPRSSNTAAPLPMTCRSCIEPMEMYKIGTR